MKILHVISFERNRTLDHRKQDDACTPKIGFESLVTFVSNNLWRDIGGSTALLEHLLTVFHLLTYAKICDFYVSLPVK